MSRRLLVVLAMVLAGSAALMAQDEGGGGGGRGGGGFGGGGESGGGGVRPPTRFEQFTGKLRMDRRTQVPKVTPILEQASTDAAPVGRKMIELQNQLVTGFLANKTDADLKPVLDTYTTTAASMTGIEAAAFGKVYAMLNPNQQRGNGPVEAFDLMAGWFHPPQPAGRGRGGAGGGGGSARFDTLIDTFRLTRDQERATKTVMDEAQKTATPVRDGLLKARPAIAAAIQGGKVQADIDAAVNAYAVQSTAMAAIEMRALAKFMQVLTPEQRGNQAAVLSTFYLMRSAFIGKNWNEVPNPDKGY